MPIHLPEPLPAELARIQQRMEGYARDYGLDFFPTIFEMVDHKQISAIAAYGGFPTRYPHWRFGMEYEQLAKGYSYGLQKIYELVINNDPCYAYLLKSNELTDQKLVMAHVYGHCDFFKNNFWFSKTDRKMMDHMANRGNRIRGYMDRFGVDVVEEFIDTCLSIEDLIDIHSPFIARYDVKDKYAFQSPEDEAPEPVRPTRYTAKEYMDPFVNPGPALEAESRRLREERFKQQQQKLPEQPMRDVLLFLLEHAPLNAWQTDILSIIREEAYYFAPQGQTKIMNEGWATFWHSTIMTRQGLDAADVVNYADHHSGTVATHGARLNPYKLGLELFRDIEERWNKGQFGQEYEECEDRHVLDHWDTGANLGRAKIFEVRRIHNDLTFIDEFLTLDFCRRHKLFSFGYNPDSEYYEIESREFPKVKERLLFSLTNRGRPLIAVRDGNYRNRGELFLEHQFSGVELQLDYARDALVALYRIWGRPVHLETSVEGTVVTMSFDGLEHKPPRPKPPSGTVVVRN